MKTKVVSVKVRWAKRSEIARLRKLGWTTDPEAIEADMWEGWNERDGDVFKNFDDTKSTTTPKP